MSREPRTTEPLPEGSFDAVVIGGGPAGVVAAGLAADAGASVLLIESKRFPRPKTCGGCLNARAVAVLDSSGFGPTLEACGPAVVEAVALHHRGRPLIIPTPPGLAVTRETMDEAFLGAARRRGVVVCEGARARVLPADRGGRRVVTLRRGTAEEATVSGKAVLACDGLGHPSLVDLPEFSPVVAADSKAGVGAVLDGSVADAVAPDGRITMVVGDSGYVGLVRCEQGRVNVAAAFRPAALRDRGAGPLVDATLRRAGLPPLPTGDATAWRGSPRLSQRSPRVAGERLFLVGDAAGYVEPFTGEGMAAAVEGAAAVVPLALEAIAGWSDRLAQQWETTYHGAVRRRQLACRALAWMLRRPLATRVGLAAASLVPAVGRNLAVSIGADRPVPGFGGRPAAPIETHATERHHQ